MRRAEQRQGDKQFGIGDADVACSGEQLVQQGFAPRVLDTGVVRSQLRKQVALGLICTIMSVRCLRSVASLTTLPSTCRRSSACRYNSATIRPVRKRPRRNTTVDLQTIGVWDCSERARCVPQIGVMSEHENSLIVQRLVEKHAAVDLLTTEVWDVSERARKLR
jgi:hypothetical protein